MRTVELATNIHSSVLGFGCAPILGSVDSKTADVALNIAYDSGVNHFDLARSYGYGEAENFVGKFIKGKRDKVVVASKFGIKANWKAKLLSPVKPLIRSIKKNRPKEVISHTGGEEKKVSIADRFHDRIPLNAQHMRLSLEQSLKALKTDYVDFFFVHEPLHTITEFEELAHTAGALKSEGKIRAWGLAYMRSQEHEHDRYLNRFDVLQFDNSPGAAGYDKVVTTRGLMPNVIFSPLRGGSKEKTPTEKLQQLFKEFPKSVILCSMFSEKHIRDNAKIAGV